jgi:hypothetical protein
MDNATAAPVAALVAAIKVSNNGYLFAPTGSQIAVAEANPEMFLLLGGSYNGLPRIAIKVSA